MRLFDEMGVTMGVMVRGIAPVGWVGDTVGGWSRAPRPCNRRGPRSSLQGPVVVGVVDALGANAVAAESSCQGAHHGGGAADAIVAWRGRCRRCGGGGLPMLSWRWRHRAGPRWFFFDRGVSGYDWGCTKGARRGGGTGRSPGVNAIAALQWWWHRRARHTVVVLPVPSWRRGGAVVVTVVVVVC